MSLKKLWRKNISKPKEKHFFVGNDTKLERKRVSISFISHQIGSSQLENNFKTCNICIFPWLYIQKDRCKQITFPGHLLSFRLIKNCQYRIRWENYIYIYREREREREWEVFFFRWSNGRKMNTIKKKGPRGKSVSVNYYLYYIYLYFYLFIYLFTIYLILTK